MATTGSSPLNLTKPEANDVVDLAVINTNYDTINTFAANTNTDLATKANQISTLNTAVGAAGTVENAVKATNVAGGAVKQIPIQSAANTTTFSPAASTAGQALVSTASTPFVGWDYLGYRLFATQTATLNGSATSANGAGGSTGILSFSSIPAGYEKLVLVLDIDAFNAGGVSAIRLNNNGSGSNIYSYGRMVYANPPTLSGSTANNDIPIGNINGVGTYVFEITNYDRANAGKVFSCFSPQLSLTGSTTLSGAINRIDVDCVGNPNMTITGTLYLVK